MRTAIPLTMLATALACSLAATAAQARARVFVASYGSDSNPCTFLSPCRNFQQAATFLFVLIGATPHTDWLAGITQRDTKGFIATGRDVDLGAWPILRKPMSFETSVPGLFAIGDVRLGSTKRVASAVGEGAGAVENIHRYLNEADQSIAEEEGRLLAARAA